MDKKIVLFLCITLISYINPSMEESSLLYFKALTIVLEMMRSSKDASNL